MNNSRKLNLDISLQSPIEEEIGLFRVRVPSYVIDARRRERSSQLAGEYLTVKYKLTLSRKAKRLLLQTLLDSVMRKKFLTLNLGEYILIEDLVDRIENEDPVENKQQIEHKIATEQMLSFAILILRVCPLSTRNLIIVPEDLKIQDILQQVLESLTYFTISDDRTYASRRAYYDSSEKIEFTVQIPLMHVDDRNSIPYDSYTRGYGESYQKRRKTPIDWEIDGEDIYEFDNSQKYQIIDLFPVYLKFKSNLE